MKIIFTFTDTPHLKSLPSDQIYNINFEVSDQALSLPDCRQRVLEIGNSIGKLTQAFLHLTCSELELKNYPIKMTKDGGQSLVVGWIVCSIKFEASKEGRGNKRELKILVPIPPPFAGYWFMSTKRGGKKEIPYIRDAFFAGFTNPAEQEYVACIKNIVDNSLVLLNTGVERGEEFRFIGFNPHVWDNHLVKKSNNRRKKENQKAKEAERAQKKLEKLQVKGLAETSSTPHPQTGAGRKGRARGGIYRGVTFRSQLEIRLATELDKRKIQWIYEKESLSEANYLVDFYLPDLKCWIEGKGQFEARDEIILPQVAEMLISDRGERLFVYTQRKAYMVNKDGLHEITLPEFWASLES